MEAKELILVEPDTNRNAFFKMIPNPDGKTFTAYYGRVNNSSRAMSRKYPAKVFQDVFLKKIAEGYEEIGSSNCKKKSSFYFDSKAVESLFDKLFYYSSAKIEENYDVNLDAISEEKINNAKATIEELVSATTVEDFNSKLVQLFKALPRKMKNVSDYLAKSKEDFDTILEAELDLLAVFETEYFKNKSVSPNNALEVDFLKENGLEVYEVSASEQEFIKRKLTKESGDWLVKAYKVINKRTEKAFHDYCKKQNVADADIKHYFHGSRNENWLNIVLKGLTIKPKNVLTNGSMFGNGCYFAPRAKKSIGYTSLEGAYWTKGSSKDGFIAIYKVAMKSPYHIYEHRAEHCNLNKKMLKERNHYSVFAHKGCSLFNDECIIYDDAACTIEYLLQINCAKSQLV